MTAARLALTLGGAFTGGLFIGAHIARAAAADTAGKLHRATQKQHRWELDRAAAQHRLETAHTQARSDRLHAENRRLADQLDRYARRWAEQVAEDASREDGR